MVKDKEMLFSNKLDSKLFQIDIPETEQLFNESIVAEDKRAEAGKIFAIIRKLLSIDVRSLFRLVDNGGEIEESIVINDLFLDVLCEAVAAPEDYAHMQNVDALSAEPDPLDMDPILEQPRLSIKTVFQTNYHKLLELQVKTKDVSFKGYVIDKLGRSDTSITRDIRNKIAMAKPGSPPPFRWFRTTDDALREMEVLERDISQQPQQQQLAKPPVKPVQPQQPAQQAQQPPEPQQAQNIQHPEPISIPELVKPVITHFGGAQATKQLAQLDRKQFEQAVLAGKKSLKGTSNWKIFRNIFFGYLSLQAAITGLQGGIQGIAALVIGYLAVRGLETLTKKEPPAPQKPLYRSKRLA